MVTVKYLGKEYSVVEYNDIMNLLNSNISSGNEKYPFEKEISNILKFNSQLVKERYSYATCDLSNNGLTVYYENSDELNTEFPKVILSVFDKQNPQESISYSANLMQQLKEIYNV